MSSISRTRGHGAQNTRATQSREDVRRPNKDDTTSRNTSSTTQLTVQPRSPARGSAPLNLLVTRPRPGTTQPGGHSTPTTSSLEPDQLFSVGEPHSQDQHTAYPVVLHPWLLYRNQPTRLLFNNFEGSPTDNPGHRAFNG